LAFQHGVYKSEVPTSLVPPVRTEAGLPVIVGTAPIHLGSDPEALQNVNKPQLVYDYAEAVALFGFSRDWEKYTLCEFIYSQFALFAVSPCILINVLDPAIHRTTVGATAYDVAEKKVNLGQDVLLDSVAFNGAPPVAGTDYSLGYDKDGNAILTLLTGGSLASANSVTVGFDRLNPDAVDEYDIIGGVNVSTGDYEGLELVNRVFPKFRLIPGLLASPKWSQNPAVTAVMRSKMDNINGHFTGQSVVDIPSDAATGADRYTEAPEWKNLNNYMAERQIVCWPKVQLGDDVFHLSTQLIGLMNKTDASNEDVPYESPSNKMLQMNACVNALGKEMTLGIEQANYLNGQGIVTALNWIGGWRAWGNRTGVYPAVTDPKDAFIPIRRMFDWIGNEFILTFWQKVDKPITKRLVRTIVNSYNIRLNGLAAREFILGGRVEFLESENPLTDLMDGILRFHIFVTPPPPAEQIIGILEFDPAYLATLFEAV
jgi:phage tail sheath protein FI